LFFLREPIKFLFLKMDGDSKKVIKENLKSAKEFISKQDYKEALNCCKKVVAEDKKNYSAFVFVGYCYHKLNQFENSELAYEKAKTIDPNLKESWLGLVELYNDNFLKEGVKEKLVDAYLHLIKVYET
jgi:superkiller protein 3